MIVIKFCDWLSDILFINQKTADKTDIYKPNFLIVK